MGCCAQGRRRVGEQPSGDREEQRSRKSRQGRRGGPRRGPPQGRSAPHCHLDVVEHDVELGVEVVAGFDGGHPPCVPGGVGQVAGPGRVVAVVGGFFGQFCEVDQSVVCQRP